MGIFCALSYEFVYLVAHSGKKFFYFPILNQDPFVLLLAVFFGLLSRIQRQFAIHQIINMHTEDLRRFCTLDDLLWLLQVVRLGSVLIEVRINKKLACPTQNSAFLFGFFFEEIQLEKHLVPQEVNDVDLARHSLQPLIPLLIQCFVLACTNV